LQHRVLADRVVRGEEGTEFKASHGLFSRGSFSLATRNYGAADIKATGERDADRNKACTSGTTPISRFRDTSFFLKPIWLAQ
jgi:hypothetical protein